MMPDISQIESLRLKDILKGVEVVEALKTDADYFNLLFELSQRATIFVYDDDKLEYCHCVNDTRGLGADKTLIIDNTNHRDVFLMRIDGVLFSSNSKCDCALLFNKNMDFVEFKSKASNKTEASQEYQYKKSYDQLKITIETFDQLFSNIQDDLRNHFEKIHAIAVFNPTVPKNLAYEKKLSAQFASEVKLKLFFTNKLKIE